MHKVESIPLIIKHGHPILVVKEISRRLYSNESHYGLRRDVNVDIKIQRPKISIQLRLLQEGDIPTLLNLSERGITFKEFRERLYRIFLVKANFSKCYLAITKEGIPCHMHWLIKSNENEKIQSVFKGGFPILKPNEALFEGVYTIPAYRNNRLMQYVTELIIKNNKETGLRWAIGFVKQSNVSSLRAMEKVGFLPYCIKEVRWRFFRRRVTYKMK
jgi:hypothetical protein